MSEGQSGNLWKALVLVGAIVLLACSCGGLYLFLYNQQDPLQGQAPDLTSQLTDLQTVCVNRAKSLKGEAIDGESEYEKAQLAASECIGYLDGVLSSGSGDQEQIKQRLEKTVAACSSFVEWADKKLPRNTGAVESASIDITAIAFGMMKLLNNQEQDRRKAVRESLQRCKFPSWGDISSSTSKQKKSGI
jgi:hypothetical protein